VNIHNYLERSLSIAEAASHNFLTASIEFI